MKKYFFEVTHRMVVEANSEEEACDILDNHVDITNYNLLDVEDSCDDNFDISEYLDEFDFDNINQEVIYHEFE